jgi:hypothetical protein
MLAFANTPAYFDTVVLVKKYVFKLSVLLYFLSVSLAPGPILQNL